MGWLVGEGSVGFLVKGAWRVRFRSMKGTFIVMFWALDSLCRKMKLMADAEETILL